MTPYPTQDQAGAPDRDPGRHVTSTQELQHWIHRAVADPGSFVERERIGTDVWDEPTYESVAKWGARAVMYVLRDLGLLAGETP